MSTSDIQKRMQGTVYGFGFRGGWYGTSNHSCGLPGGARVLVRPEYSPVDGAAVVVVTPETVSMWVCAYPSNYSNWRQWEDFGEYRSEMGLKLLLENATKQPQGMWAQKGEL